MAQQMITLEEAAARLAISPEEMKKRLKTDPDFKKLSQIRDGSTVRFKVAAIDELARQLGMPTEDGSLPFAADLAAPGSDDFKVSGLDDPKPARKAAPDDGLLDLGGAATDDEVFSLADEPKKGGLSSGKLAPPRPPKSSPNLSDSSAGGGSGKLVPGRPPKSSPNLSDSSAGGSDSDVRLDGGKSRRPRADEAAVPTEEIALDFGGGPGSAVIKGGSAAKLSGPKGGSSGKLAPKGKGNKLPADVPPPDSSEFELSLDADSDDFDLQMNAEGGDEVDLGGLPKSAAPRSSASGINLGAPKDSGVSLERGKGKSGPAGGKSGAADASKANKKSDESDASDADFELSLDSSAAASSTKLGAPKSGKLVLESESDSEFELTLDDSHGSLEQAALGDAGASGDKGDIFETDFEIPAMPDESGSEAVALESDTDLEKSDFELAMDDEGAAEESESEVVLLDDEAAPGKAKGRAKAAPARRTAAGDADVDLSDDATTDDEDTSASRALRGSRVAKRGEDEDEEAVPAGAAAAAKPWGVLPALFLAPSLLFCLIGALMGYELLQTMWGYQQPRKPTAPLVRGLASQFDMELRDQ